MATDTLSSGTAMMDLIQNDAAAPAFLTTLRNEARGFFESLPWPTHEDEAWRRTDISHLPFETLTRGVLTIGVDLPAGNGAGVLFKSLAAAVRENPALVAPHLGKIVESGRGKLEALNSVLWTDGLFVYVPPGVDATVVLSGAYTAALRSGTVVFPRTLVVVGQSARLTYVEKMSSDAHNGASVSCGVSELFLGENADVRTVHVQRWGQGVNPFHTQNARLSANARLTSLVVALGGDVSRANLGSDLTAPGAESSLYGLVFGDRDQRFTHHTWQNHQAPNTTSQLLFKSALQDNSRSIYTGLVKIDKIAQKTNAYQSSKNILLSPGARANAIPMLEILADDVKCGHGAAVGGLDDDQKFYLMSRGFKSEEAERVLVEGFFEEILQRVPVPNVHDQLRSAIDEKLARGARG